MTPAQAPLALGTPRPPRRARSRAAWTSLLVGLAGCGSVPSVPDDLPSARPVTDPPAFRAVELPCVVDGEPRPVPAQLRGPVLDPDAPRDTHPLLVFLHGVGERGDDNTAQLAHLPEYLTRPEWAGAFDGYVLAVQCPGDARWVEVAWDDPTPAMPAEISPALARVSLALDHLLATRPIDPDRVHLTGLSMGGMGAWDLALRRPDTFASLCTVCGGGDPREVGRIAHLPIQVWHGVDDPVVPLERSGCMVEALREAGADVRYHELPPGTGHAAWEGAYAADSPYWAWLRAQVRGARAGG